MAPFELSPAPVRTVLVVGASGVLGAMVARGQLAAGNKVRAFGRDPSRLASLCNLGAEAVIGDLSDRDAIAAACQGADQVFTSAHGFVAPGRHGSRNIDLVGNRNLVEVAAGQGVQHLVFTSVCRLDAMTAIDFMAYKRATEDTLVASGLPYTILRPTVFMDTWAWLVGGAILASRPVPVYGDGRNPVNFVAASDVAEVAGMVLARDKPGREPIEIGGPEDLSQLQVIEIFERVLGKKAAKHHVSTTVLSITSRIARLFKPALSRQLATGHFMATSPQPFLAPSAGQHYSLPMTRFEEWIRLQWLPGMSSDEHKQHAARAMS